MERIDPHVHCRNNIRKTSELARKQGIGTIIDVHPIFLEKDVIKRLSLLANEQPAIPYLFYVGITKDKTQIREAVRMVKTYPLAAGLKMRTTDSFDSPGVLHRRDQFGVYETLVEENYRGVLMVHCEKQGKFKSKLWDPVNPWTHDLAQPTKAETSSIADQIKSAKKAGFMGNLHIAHVSCAKSVEMALEAKRDLNITCGVTPHHILWSSEKMKERLGIIYRVNPPLRSEETVIDLRNCLVHGKIDWIETDYAPHILKEKLCLPYRPGIAAYDLYSDLLDWLSKKGVTKHRIDNLTRWNIKKVFGKKLKET